MEILNTISPDGRDKENLSAIDMSSLNAIYKKIISIPKYSDLESINKFLDLYEYKTEKFD